MTFIARLDKNMSLIYTLIRGRNMPQLRAKDNPYGLAPIRVTEAESKPSTLTSPKASADGCWSVAKVALRLLIFLVILLGNWRGLFTPSRRATLSRQPQTLRVIPTARGCFISGGTIPLIFLPINLTSLVSIITQKEMFLPGGLSPRRGGTPLDVYQVSL